MGKIKDGLYNYFVRKNGRVWYEYERYVREHMAEHRLHRWRHIRILIKLNWFYRIKKGNTPYLYWDEPLNPNDSKVAGANPNVSLTQAGSKLYTTEYEERQRSTAYAFAVGLRDYDVISFDAFDTLILRTVNLPEHLFMILGEINGIYDFTRWRVKAEKEVREQNLLLRGNRECTLKEIYEKLSHWTGIDPDKGMKTEYEAELQFCKVNPYMLQVYQILKSMKKTIYVTSNMYLTKEMLKTILEKCGYSYFEDILVSCEYECSKTTGALFNILKEKEKDRKIVHIGDNQVADIKGANIAGIDSRYYQTCRERGEKYRARGFSSLIGSAYYATVNNKLHNGTAPKRNYSKLWEFGYLYGGITTLGYVQWIHEKAKKECKEIIIFLARDGALLKQVYDELFDDIPSGYLLWSRIAAMRNVNAGTRSQVLDRLFTENSNKGMTISDLLSIMGWEKLEQDINNFGICTKVPLVTENEKIVKDWLIENWHKIEKMQIDIEKKTLDYIKKIICAHRRICFVDLGWTGKNALILKQLLINEGYESNEISICLLGSINKLQNPIKIYNDELNCYMFSFNYNREIHDAFCKMSTYALDVLEKMYSVSACSFVGINAKGNYLFAAPEIENYRAYDMISQGVIDFCEDYLNNYANLPFMLNISGYDAWVAIRHALRNKQMISEIMQDLVFNQGISISSDRPDFVNLCQ